MSVSTSDEILMAAYQAGSEDAFRALFERHSGSVYGFLVRRLPDRTLADDLFQEVFLRLHRARATWQAGRPFKPWLFGIVHNLLVDTVRERARSPVAPGPVGADDGARAARAPAADDPEGSASARESTLALARVLRSLPDDEATVLLLARVEGLSYDDIGPILGRSAAAVKQLAYRALKRVRAGMAAAGHGDLA